MRVLANIDLEKVIKYIKENPGVTTSALQSQFDLTKHGIGVLTSMLDRSGKIKKFPRSRHGTIYYDSEYDGIVKSDTAIPAIHDDQYLTATAKMLQRGIWGKTMQLEEDDVKTARKSTDTENVSRPKYSQKQGAYWRSDPELRNVSDHE